MQRFYFHLHSDVDALDSEGKELPDLGAARQHAVEAARFEVSKVAKEGRIVLSHRVDVADRSGAVLATVHFSDVVEIEP
jgi:hypothetical protein